MRVACVCTHYTTVPPVMGGAVQMHIAGIAPYLSRVHDVTVICTRLRNLPDMEEREGVKYVRLPAESEAEYAQRVARWLQREAYDLVHVFNRPAWIVPFAQASPKSRWLLRIHNAMFEPEKLSYREALACLQRVDAIDTVSDYMARTITRRFPHVAAKIRTIYTGVDTDRFQPVWSSRARDMRFLMRNRLGLGSEPVILYVGRLSEVKGADVLIAAMPRILSEVPDAVLVVGSRWFGANERTPYVQRLERQARELGPHVRFTGYMHALEIEQAYAAADVFVCPSRWEEPLARVHFEAMAAGLPVVSSRRGGNPEVVFPGINGWLVDDHENPDAFAEVIIALLKDPQRRRAMGEAGRRMVEARFTWYRAAAETLDVYDRVLWRSAEEPVGKLSGGSPALERG